MLATPPMPPELSAGVFPISQRQLVVKLPSISQTGAIDVREIADPSAWSVLRRPPADESDRPECSFERLTVADATARFFPSGPNNELEREAYLAFQGPFVEGCEYLLSWDNGAIDWGFIHQPDLNWTPSIKVNQLGYLPESLRRYAYVGHWVPDQEPFRLASEDERQFHIVNVDTETVEVRGVMSPRLRSELGEDRYGFDYSGTDVYELDLFALLNPGWYYIVWEGVGRSWTFQVDNALYKQAFKALLNGLAASRCDSESEGASVCETSMVCVSEVDLFAGDDFEYPRFEQARDALRGGDECVPLVVTGGHHDGDDDARFVFEAYLIDALVNLYLAYPETMLADDLGIPESGNGIPDVLDTALVSFEFLSGLQPTYGAVHGGVTARTRPPLPGEARSGERPFYAYAQSMKASYLTAGALAKLALALSELEDGGLEEVADEVRTRANGAWESAEREMVVRRQIQDAENQDDMGPQGGENETGMILPEFDDFIEAYGAAGMLRGFGATEYARQFLEYAPFSQTGTSANAQEDYLLQNLTPNETEHLIGILLTFLEASEEVTRPVRVAAETLEARALDWLEIAGRTAYRGVKHPFAYDAYDRGGYTSAVYAEYLLRMYRLTARSEYLDWALFTVDLILGANPMGLSFVSGLGSDSVAAPYAVGQSAALGVPSYGPCQSQACEQEPSPALQVAQGLVIPPYANWPLGERFFDGGHIPEMNGFSIRDTFPQLLYTFGALWANEGVVLDADEAALPDIPEEPPFMVGGRPGSDADTDSESTGVGGMMTQGGVDDVDGQDSESVAGGFSMQADNGEDGAAEAEDSGCGCTLGRGQQSPVGRFLFFSLMLLLLKPRRVGGRC